jgi:hypothetical protein
MDRSRAHAVLMLHLPTLDWRWFGIRRRCRHCGQRHPCPPRRAALDLLTARGHPTVPMPSLHEPTRPSWRCAACGDEWPCAPRREELLLESGGSSVALGLRMAQYFAVAVTDHPDVPPAVLYLRFFGWLRHAQR